MITASQKFYRLDQLKFTAKQRAIKDYRVRRNKEQLLQHGKYIDKDNFCNYFDRLLFHDVEIIDILEIDDFKYNKKGIVQL